MFSLHVCKWLCNACNLRFALDLFRPTAQGEQNENGCIKSTCLLVFISPLIFFLDIFCSFPIADKLEILKVSWICLTFFVCDLLSLKSKFERNAIYFLDPILGIILEFSVHGTRALTVAWKQAWHICRNRSEFETKHNRQDRSYKLCYSTWFYLPDCWADNLDRIIECFSKRHQNNCCAVMSERRQRTDELYLERKVPVDAM